MKIIFILLFILTGHAQAYDLKTNAVHMAEAPTWVTAGRVNSVVEHIQSLLEWDIRRIEVVWYKDQAQFEKMHGLGPLVVALAKRADNSVHIGPDVNTKNFDAVFGHELVHVISYQKYKDAIPTWLEEGLANHLSHLTKVDYAWLQKHTPPKDVRDLTHPFNGSEDHIRYHYMASQALMEMISSHCDLANLLRLSVRRKLEDKLDTFCGIKDVTRDFNQWVRTHKI
jgi:hypothetical protein